LEKYDVALYDFYELLDSNDYNISFVSLLQKYSIFWKNLCNWIKIDKFIDLGIVEIFDIYMYQSMEFFFNFINFIIYLK